MLNEVATLTLFARSNNPSNPSIVGLRRFARNSCMIILWNFGGCAVKSAEPGYGLEVKVVGQSQPQFAPAQVHLDFILGFFGNMVFPIDFRRQGGHDFDMGAEEKAVT